MRTVCFLSFLVPACLFLVLPLIKLNIEPHPENEYRELLQTISFSGFMITVLTGCLISLSFSMSLKMKINFYICLVYYFVCGVLGFFALALLFDVREFGEFWRLAFFLACVSGFILGFFILVLVSKFTCIHINKITIDNVSFNSSDQAQ